MHGDHLIINSYTCVNEATPDDEDGGKRPFTYNIEYLVLIVLMCLINKYFSRLTPVKKILYNLNEQLFNI